jgi:hypothetical protein
MRANVVGYITTVTVYAALCAAFGRGVMWANVWSYITGVTVFAVVYVVFFELAWRWLSARCDRLHR